MTFSKNINSIQTARLRVLFSLECAARSLGDLHEAENTPAIKSETAKAAGEIHKIAETLKRRWKIAQT